MLLATVGTLGDLHPFLGLARALQAQGCSPTLASAAEYRERALAAGVPFQPLRPSHATLERDLGLTRGELTRATIARPEFLFRSLVLPYLRATYEDMQALCAESDLVLTSSLAFGARLAAEVRGLPWIGVVLQPFMLLSAYDPPVLPHMEWLAAPMRALGPRAAGAILRLLQAGSAPLFAPVRALRRELGLPPTRAHPLFAGQFCGQGAIGLYSPVLGGPQPDHPPRTAILGFSTYDGAPDGAPDGAGTPDLELEAFLGAAAAPLVFTLGSLLVNSPGGFWRESLEAARVMDRRAVLLVGEEAMNQPGGHGLPEQPGHALVRGYVPHSQLFPRAACVVHQGGIGTLAQALRAGRPQLIVPFFADQIDNAARAQRLGVARVLAPSRYRAGRVGRELEALQSDAGYAQRAAELGRRVAGEDGAAAAARLISARLG